MAGNMSDTYKTECRAVNELLVALAAGELEGELEASLRAHLAQCDDCRAELATISQTQTLAASLQFASPQLASPQLDRYPEFLRRLAARESETTPEARPTESLALLPVPATDNALPSATETPFATASAPGGVAAIIPFFGQRIAVRNGFGQGFALSVSSGQGRQWLELRAKSLTRVAVVAAGVSLAAAISLVAFLLLFFSFKPRSEPPQVISPATAPEVAHVPAQAPDSAGQPPHNENSPPWLLTAANETNTLVLWRRESQVQFAWYAPQTQTIGQPFILSLPPGIERQAQIPRATDFALATDGQGVVVLREYSGDLWFWYLQPETSTASGPPPARLLARRAVHPAITWAGNRFLAVWTEPDRSSPAIKLLPLGHDGNPLQTDAALIAVTENGRKLAFPSVAGDANKALITYLIQGGNLQARLWTQTEGRNVIGEAQQVAHINRISAQPLRLAQTSDGFLAAWAETPAENSQLCLVRLNAQGQPQPKQVLARPRTPVSTFDWRVTDTSLQLLWTETPPGGAQSYWQEFALNGAPQTAPQVQIVDDSRPAAAAFGDLSARALLWLNVQPGSAPIHAKAIARD